MTAPRSPTEQVGVVVIDGMIDRLSSNEHIKYY